MLKRMVFGDITEKICQEKNKKQDKLGLDFQHKLAENKQMIASQDFLIENINKQRDQQKFDRWQNSPLNDFKDYNQAVNLYTKFSTKIKAFQAGYQKQKQQKINNKLLTKGVGDKQNLIKLSKLPIKKINNSNKQQTIKQTNSNKQNQQNNRKEQYERMKKYITPESQKWRQNFNENDNIQQSIEFVNKTQLLRAKQVKINFECSKRLMVSTSRGSQRNPLSRNRQKILQRNNIKTLKSQNSTRLDIINVQYETADTNSNEESGVKNKAIEKIDNDKFKSFRSEIKESSRISKLDNLNQFKTVASCFKSFSPCINNLVMQFFPQQNDKTTQNGYGASLNIRRAAFLTRNMREKKIY